MRRLAISGHNRIPGQPRGSTAGLATAAVYRLLHPRPHDRRRGADSHLSPKKPVQIHGIRRTSRLHGFGSAGNGSAPF